MNFTDVLDNTARERFRQAANRLFTECFLLKSVKETAGDYLFVQRNLELFQSYFAVAGYELKIQEEYGVIGLYSSSGAGRIHLRKFDSILLLILRLLYIEQRKKLTGSREIYITVEQIYDKYNMLNLRDRIERKRTEMRTAMGQFKRLRLLRNLDSDLSDPETRLEIYPSILLAITADSLQSMYETAQAQLAQYEMGGDEDDTVQAQDADSDPAD